MFTELLEKGKKKEAFHVASSLFFLITLVLGAITALFIIFAEPLMSVFAPGFDDNPALKDLTVGLTQLMFPIVLLLALSGVVVGMLNSFEHFSVPALAPTAWNLVIIAALVGLTPLFEGQERVYAYAIGVLVGTVVQFVLPLPWLRGRGGHFSLALDWRNPHVLKVLKLMFPVTIALGMINLSLLINSLLGTLVSDQAPAAIDKAFRIYQLPQGLFSISIATILFPTMSKLAARGATDDLRSTMANGVRQVALLLIPSAVLMAVLAEPITRLVYQRGEFDAEATELVKTAMVWWSISLPFQGISLLFSRTFFSLQQPWATTALAFVNMVVNGLVSLALYKPFGIAGIVIGTVVGTLVMTARPGLAAARPARRDRGGEDAEQRPADAGRRRPAGGRLLRRLGRAGRAAGPVAARPAGVRGRGHRRRAGRVRGRRLGAAGARGAPDPGAAARRAALAAAVRHAARRAPGGRADDLAPLHGQGALAGAQQGRQRGPDLVAAGAQHAHRASVRSAPRSSSERPCTPGGVAAPMESRIVGSTSIDCAGDRVGAAALAAGPLDEQRHGARRRPRWPGTRRASARPGGSSRRGRPRPRPATRRTWPVLRRRSSTRPSSRSA